MTIEAVLSLKGDALPAVGRERIRLLEAIARHGSISAGAKARGLTYRAAWQALDGMASLFGRPLLATRAGGARGGGSVLTDTGRNVILAYHWLDAELAQLTRRLGRECPGIGIAAPRHAAMLVKTSARNALPGRIVTIDTDGFVAEVVTELSPTAQVRARVTTDSLHDLGLRAGRDVIVMIKATLVALRSCPEPLRAGLNCVAGTIAPQAHGANTAQIRLDIGAGLHLSGSPGTAAARDHEFAEGHPAWAVFEAAHVILAIDHVEDDA
ncbi:TOBE domain-containing protein [Lichenifustis flavocetrariae]|uniref:TOBE domain-containing protein n=1 Tax=Lichenifustis flavocetrariae TaxID=2949735 RepID=A0AA41YXS8_9HYPH|nr:TOBE domain-containing protein [Lichenifustis flavocetrariae]MCW6508983.1 TOBE domain-containing protein [Lichenifustis flavocetrariae]